MGMFDIGRAKEIRKIVILLCSHESRPHIVRLTLCGSHGERALQFSVGSAFAASREFANGKVALPLPSDP